MYTIHYKYLFSNIYFARLESYIHAAHALAIHHKHNISFRME